MNNNYILELRDVVKKFSGVTALNNVHLEIKKGEIHALCGENGAGKSTLMKIISGAQNATSGQIIFEGNKVEYNSIKDAQNLGISMIYQELNLVPQLTVAENIFLGKLPIKMGMVDWVKLFKDTQKLLDTLGLKISPKTKIAKLSVAQKQMVEIAKCLSFNSKVIIMDEPTAALTNEEIDTLFKIIRGLVAKSISIIYISHRMDEIFSISDSITVFRDGKHVKTLETKNTDYDEIVSLMVGQNIQNLYPQRDEVKEDKIFEVKGITGQDVNDVSFILNKSEILAIYGLMGSGNIELSKIIYGAIKKISGDIIINEKRIKKPSPLNSIKAGIGLVPDDRKNEGLVLVRSIKENISLASIKKITRFGVINNSMEKNIVNESVDAMRIKISSQNQIVGKLSGGNQQKVVLSKILRTSPEVLFLDEPTRGVDVGAKTEIYQIMNKLTKKGKSIILISTDLPEVIGMADRILIMREGKIVKEVMKKDASQELVLTHASGGVTNE
ncbi:sugar ABC transporter ATP-binding protein [Clostridium sp.]|uniref:sugar ABC transporter ATP-binding protein n=1 Tax=Clostridium sp. TaxID=1506 RepID=UPI001A3FEB72|nr:sugar ABC transporter ATP-binding protein [Clostridium sp.]MBK5240632.1 sugar ABC transporter ATP-binding protein [Clostridium sp.]